jgi:hypothetical protein
MKYLTSITEERDVLRVTVHEKLAGAVYPVALLVCSISPNFGLADAIAEAIRCFREIASAAGS